VINKFCTPNGLVPSRKFAGLHVNRFSPDGSPRLLMMVAQRASQCEFGGNLIRPVTIRSLSGRFDDVKLRPMIVSCAEGAPGRAAHAPVLSGDLDGAAWGAVMVVKVLAAAPQ